MAELKFVNSDARPKMVVLHVSRESVAPIMDWYGGFHAGDRYRVTLDGLPLVKDHYGSLVGAIPTPPKDGGA